MGERQTRGSHPRGQDGPLPPEWTCRRARGLGDHLEAQGIGAAAFGPGRANLIGEHTDYNDGLSLAFALDRGVTVSAEPRADWPQVRGGAVSFVRGMVAELEAAGFELRPVALTIESTLPQGAGLASSAALETALCLALIDSSGLDPPADRVMLARLCSRVENVWVGARTGLLDQIASLLGEEGQALRIDFRTLEVRPVPLALADWRLVAVPSGERHSLAAGSGYDRRRWECGRARVLLGLLSLRDAAPDAAAALPAPLDRRVRHVLEENARVEATIAALERSDLAEVGRLLDASHRSLRDLYEASTDAVERTVERLMAAGAAGARMMGGGFGGSVLALFPPGREPPDGCLELRPSRGARLLH